MAPLTWRNVDAPNFSGVTASLGVASQLLNNATSGLSDAIDKRRATMRQGASSEAMLAALQYTDAEKLGEALRNGTALGNVDPRMLTPEALNFLGSRQRDLLGNDSVRLGNVGAGIRNETSQFNLDEGRKTANIQDGYRANQPAANQRMAEIRTLFDSGDPTQIARGRKLMADSSRLFTSAGYSNDDAMKLMSGNVDAANAGINFNANVAQQQDFYEERYRKQGEKGLLNGLVQNAIDAPDALNQINKMKGLDAQTKSNLTKQITENKDTYFPAPSPLDVLPTKAGNPTAILNEYAAVTPRANQNAQQSGVPYIGYDNKNAKRNMPLANELVSAMDFLPEMGVEMRVVSGGQKDQASGTGSPRHNGGMAGDVDFYMGGRKLDWNNPADVPIFQEIVRRGKEKGLTGFGAGDDYMGAGRMHIGFGKAGVWGANGKGANAPAWLRDAFDGAGQGPSPNSIMFNNAASRNPGTVTAPTDTTATSIMRGAMQPPTQVIQTNTPNNQPVQVAVDNTAAAPVAPTATVPTTDNLQTKELPGGNKAFVDSNGQLFQKSGNDYIQVDNTGMPIGSGAYQPEALKQQAAPAQVPVQNPPAKRAPTPTEVLKEAQTLNNTGMVDSFSNTLGGLEQQLAERPFRGQQPADIVRSLRGTEKEPGPLSNVPETALMDAINQISKRAGVDPDVAALLAKQSVEGRDLGGSWYLGYLNSGDAYGRSTEGSRAPRVNVDEAVRLMDNFRQAGSDKAGSTAPGDARYRAVQDKAAAQQQVQALAQNVAAINERMVRIQVELQNNPGDPRLQALYAQAQTQLQIVQAQLTLAQRDIQKYGANNLVQ